MQVRKNEHIGYVWFSPVVDNVWELHACCHPDVKRGWLTRKFVRECYKTLEDIGAEKCLAFHWGVGFEDMLLKLGFDIGDAVSILDIRKKSHGINVWRSKQEPAPSACGSEATAK